MRELNVELVGSSCCWCLEAASMQSSSFTGPSCVLCR